MHEVRTSDVILIEEEGKEQEFPPEVQIEPVNYSVNDDDWW